MANRLILRVEYFVCTLREVIDGVIVEDVMQDRKKFIVVLGVVPNLCICE